MELYGKDATPNSLDEETARILLYKTTSFCEDKAPKAMSILEAGFDDDAAVLLLPEKNSKRLRTTNSIERLNEEIRRRERVIRIFLNRESVIRLARCSAHGTRRETDHKQEIFRHGRIFYLV